MKDLEHLVEFGTCPGKVGITIDLGEDMVKLIAAITAIAKVTPVVIESVSIICGYLGFYFNYAYNAVEKMYSNYTAVSDQQDPYSNLVLEVVGESELTDYSIES